MGIVQSSLSNSFDAPDLHLIPYLHGSRVRLGRCRRRLHDSLSWISPQEIHPSLVFAAGNSSSLDRIGPWLTLACSGACGVLQPRYMVHQIYVRKTLRSAVTVLEAIETLMFRTSAMTEEWGETPLKRSLSASANAEKRGGPIFCGDSAHSQKTARRLCSSVRLSTVVVTSGTMSKYAGTAAGKSDDVIPLVISLEITFCALRGCDLLQSPRFGMVITIWTREQDNEDCE
jgi:hypothetical protein